MTRRRAWRARYRCLRCGCTWEQDAGYATCPDCGHERCAWIAYCDEGRANGTRTDD